MFFFQVFTIAYGVASQALLYPFRETNVAEAVSELLGRSYLNVFGEIDLEGFDDHLKTGINRLLHLFLTLNILRGRKIYGSSCQNSI